MNTLFEVQFNLFDVNICYSNHIFICAISFDSEISILTLEKEVTFFLGWSVFTHCFIEAARRLADNSAA
jgi:hypothetical protein